jgi:GrpB-like predicted nucleotidyltransferase (UPF0157 family)
MPASGDWPAWATEAVSLAGPDEGWASRGAAERGRLLDLLAPWLVDDVHHVGSTAVPGLPAKPIVDLMAGVGSWERFFVKVAADRRVAHLHLLDPATPRWAERLRFRDRLRARPGLAAEYAELKRGLARDHAGDREAYTQGQDRVRATGAR